MVGLKTRTTKSTVACVLLSAASLLLTTPFLYGQSGTTGSIFGTISDKSGAVVAQAEVTATNTETGLKRNTSTNSTGYYRMEFLPVGPYAVEITAPGFSKLEQTGIVLVATQSTKVDAALNPGSVTASVKVTGAAPLINTNNAEVGTTVENIQVTELPIVNRNVYTLLDITPGVQQNSNQVGLGLPEQHTSMNGGVEAGYSASVNYYLDGGANVGSLRNSGNILPNPDAIEEFRILEDNYSAEYGRFASGVVSVLTKSGTNNLHGTLFEFLRNNELNANNWGSTIPLAALREKQPEVARKQLTELVAEFPENPLFASELAKLNGPPAAAIPRSVKPCLDRCNSAGPTWDPVPRYVQLDEQF